MAKQTPPAADPAAIEELGGLGGLAAAAEGPQTPPDASSTAEAGKDPNPAADAAKGPVEPPAAPVVPPTAPPAVNPTASTPAGEKPAKPAEDHPPAGTVLHSREEREFIDGKLRLFKRSLVATGDGGREWQQRVPIDAPAAVDA